VILVVGISPAWQRILKFDQLAPGEVNRAADVIEIGSGKVINVAQALHSLGHEMLMLTTLGGERGKKIAHALNLQRTFNYQAFWTEAETRVCQTLLEPNRTTELVEECQPLAEHELRAFQDLFELQISRGKCLVLTGSVPAGVPKDFYRGLIEQAKCPTIVDAQGELLRESLAGRPTVIKPNREELARTVGRELSTTGQIVTAAEELRAEGAKWVVVSDGSRPVTVVGPVGVYVVAPASSETPVNPIGCGDALTAGIAAVLATDELNPVLQGTRLGVACGLANLEQLLPCRLDPARVENWRSRLDIEMWLA
jgi:tagatose 6-phosphate kinase